MNWILQWEKNDCQSGQKKALDLLGEFKHSGRGAFEITLVMVSHRRDELRGADDGIFGLICEIEQLVAEEDERI